MELGTVRTIAEKIVLKTPDYPETFLELIPEYVLSTTLVDGNLLELTNRIDAIRFEEGEYLERLEHLARTKERELEQTKQLVETRETELRSKQVAKREIEQLREMVKTGEIELGQLKQTIETKTRGMKFLLDVAANIVHQ